MTKYTITNTTSGHVLGDYEGATPLAAYREHLTAAGYRETDVRATMARVAAEREADSDWQSIDAADDLDWDTIPADLSVEEVDTTDTPTITAEITGRGKDSQCRDEPGAVDADIYADGEKVGEVTLMPDRQTGELGAWGDLEHWASSDLIDWLDGRDDRQEIISAIVAAVREEAADASGSTYTYSIFDADPSASSVTPLDGYDDCEIEADDEAGAVADVKLALGEAAAGCCTDDGYAIGDTLHAVVWAADGSIVATLTRTLTADDLDIDDADTDTFAVIDLDTMTITSTHELTDAQRDEMARQHGRALVYLLLGGKVGDKVAVDADGCAEVVAGDAGAR